MNLVVGATGMLGGAICSLLAEQGSALRALVREGSSSEKVERLRSLGADVVRGDLVDRASLVAACRGANAVFSTASSLVSRKDGDAINNVDRQGQLDLIDAAEEAGAKHFILISFPSVDVDFPLQTAKRAVEERLRQGRMNYSILQPTFFMEIWLSPALGFDMANGAVRIYGDGHNKLSWISYPDVAKFAVAALNRPQAINAAIKLGGPDALSPLEVVRMAEHALVKTIIVEHVPEEALREQYRAATDSLQQSLVGLMLYYAHADAVELAEALRVLPVHNLTSVDEYLRTTG